MNKNKAEVKVGVWLNRVWSLGINEDTENSNEQGGRIQFNSVQC